MKTTPLATRLFGSLIAALLPLLFAALGASAQVAHSPAHVMENPGAAKWGPAPPMLPPGAQIAVLAGNPSRPEPYAVRLKFPASYDIQAHSHPTDEHVVVVSGELFMGMGNKLDKKSALGLAVGGFALMPANANHFAFTRAETTIVLYGQGPVEFNYVNPADDPRTPSPSRR